MNNLKKNMDIDAICFISDRYWTDKGEREKITALIFSKLVELFKNSGVSIQTFVIENEQDLEDLSDEKNRFAIFVPLSGAMQPLVLTAAKKYSTFALWAAYVKGNLDPRSSDLLIERNAAPALMDIFSVLKRQLPTVKLVINLNELKTIWQIHQALFRLKNAKLLLLGQTEPWVISSTRDFNKITEIFGTKIESVNYDELIEIFQNQVDKKEIQKKADVWKNRAEKIIEPSESDLHNAVRLVIAVEKLLAQKNGDGIALACFKLLNLINTTSCLAVSELNSSDNFIGGCEGDLDSAITLMLVKALSGKPGWIANPNIQPDGNINFVHCTAPLNLSGDKNPYALRSHHESGIGVSPEVELPKNQTVTLVRVSNEEKTISIQTGTATESPKEPSCRTQLKIQIDSLDKYLDHVLGCHQVIVYGDISHELEQAARFLELKILE
ncbi:hypothetical protein B6D60_11445 [candidate division KSB1 bacterium 4484_87]|nr:MAG: hypothetical protein B6D60_11445 [candidate division KSB1 bacterium 4484_87]